MGGGREVGNREGESQLGRPRHRWEDNIEIDLEEVERGGMDWIDLDHDWERWRTLCDCGNEPSGSIICGEFLYQLRTG